MVEGGRRFRNRLVGTAIVERWGFETTGLFLDEIMPEGGYREFIHELYRDACRHRAPVYSSSLFRWDVGRHMVTRRLYLPLTHGNEAVEMVLRRPRLGRLAVQQRLEVDAQRVAGLARDRQRQPVQGHE